MTKRGVPSRVQISILTAVPSGEPILQLNIPDGGRVLGSIMLTPEIIEYLLNRLHKLKGGPHLLGPTGP